MVAASTVIRAAVVQVGTEPIGNSLGRLYALTPVTVTVAPALDLVRAELEPAIIGAAAPAARWQWLGTDDGEEGGNEEGNDRFHHLLNYVLLCLYVAGFIGRLLQVDSVRVAVQSDQRRPCQKISWHHRYL